MLTFTEMIRRYSEAHRSKMKTLTSTLSNNFGIDYFHFHQVKNDGRFFFIANCIEYNEFFWDQPEIRAGNPFTICPRLITEGVYSSEFQDFPGWNKATKFLREQINIDHSATLFQKIKDGYIVGSFGFSNSRSQSANNFTNDIDAINAYISYFTEEISFILKKSEDDAVDLNVAMGKSFRAPSCFMRDGREIKQAYYKSLSPGKDRTILSVPDFTERELECLKCCVGGLTARQIGKKLHIAKRTAEHRTEAIKNKLGCSKKSEIISVVQHLQRQGLVYL